MSKVNEIAQRITLVVEDKDVVVYVNDEQLFRASKDRALTLTGKPVHNDYKQSLYELIRDVIPKKQKGWSAELDGSVVDSGSYNYALEQMEQKLKELFGIEG